MKFDQWLDQLNDLGLYAPLHSLRAHIDATPRAESGDELATIRLAEVVWQQRSAGRDILNLIAA